MAVGSLAATVADRLATGNTLVVVLITFVFLAAETSLFIGLLLPGDVVSLFAGATVDSVPEYAVVAAAAMVGSLVGESFGYLLGRRYGARLRYSRLGRRLGERRWQRAEWLALGRDGGWALVSSRFLPVLHTMIPVLAGTLGVPYRRFIAWEALGGMLWGLTYVGLGAIMGTGLREHGHQFGYAGSAVLVAAILIIAAVARRLRGAESGDPA